MSAYLLTYHIGTNLIEKREYKHVKKLNLPDVGKESCNKSNRIRGSLIHSSHDSIILPKSEKWQGPGFWKIHKVDLTKSKKTNQ